MYTLNSSDLKYHGQNHTELHQSSSDLIYHGQNHTELHQSSSNTNTDYSLFQVAQWRNLTKYKATWPNLVRIITLS